MARTITYWYDVMDAERQTMASLSSLEPNINTAQSLLSDVKTTSKVARWRLWFWCVAALAYAIDVLFDQTKSELETIAANSRYGTLPWYVSISKEYQAGYSLNWSGTRFEYLAIDDAAKIVKRAAAVEIATSTISIVNLKVAKLSGTTPAALSAAEKSAFAAYIAQVKPAGVAVNIISDNPDDLRLFLSIDYDPLVLTASGESIATPGVFPVEVAVNDYISNLPFNGSLELDDLIDAVQNAVGVVNAYVTNAEARYGANPFVTFTQSYSSNAGHLKIDVATPLNSSITYIANV
ncbi:MAG: hypothetical protein L6Q66_03605 [Bacteroidia bacterium]|nr:hypothetical protein [Bacteroidia bacterium]